jgi:glycosyltransferase involved in cell wall biosynthesis
MKIAIVVHGRFHSFDFAKGLLNLGHDITVFTNYPRWAVRRFGLPTDCVRSFWIHGIASRILYKFSGHGLWWDPSSFLHPFFGRWVSRQIRKSRYDVVHAFSGVALEPLTDRSSASAHLMVRGSSHIFVQDQLLHEEEIRAKMRVERPSAALIAREQREYEIADRVVTLSSFARDSFVSRGVDKDKLEILSLGVDVSQFCASPEVLAARRERILSGDPLRVLWVGTMSLRKGLLDYERIVAALGNKDFQFRFVGDIPKDVHEISAKAAKLVEVVARQPQWQLPQQYAWADLFIFPTIEDGYAVVLAQASANGLPILTTPNCAGPDMIRPDQTGWILPIRSPEAFIERLRWCDRNREAVAEMVVRMANDFSPRTWDDVARDFTKICQRAIASNTEKAQARNDSSRAPLPAGR